MMECIMKRALATPPHKHPPARAPASSSTLKDLYDTGKAVAAGVGGIDGVTSIPDMFSSWDDLSKSLGAFGAAADISAAIANHAAFGAKGDAISSVLSDVGDGIRSAGKVASAVKNFKDGGAEGILNGLSDLSGAGAHATQIFDLTRTTAILNSTANGLSASSQFLDVDSVAKGFGAAASTLSSASQAFKAGELNDVADILGDFSGVAKSGRGIANIAEGNIVPDKSKKEEGSTAGNLFGLAGDLIAGAGGAYDLGKRVAGSGKSAS